jgi:hypothetical protein
MANFRPSDAESLPPANQPAGLHPAWRAFISYCARLQHGDIERLSIQNGLPVIAELTKQKVKFTS